MNFNWANPYPTIRTPVFARNVVATSQPLAAQAGLRILQNGGNAVDAAIAAAAVITMTEPCSNGLGADNFAIVWDPESRRLHGLNSSGTAPAAWTPEYFKRKYREQTIPTARLGFRNGSGSGGRMVVAARKIWQAHLRRCTGARRSSTRSAGSRSARRCRISGLVQLHCCATLPGFAEHFLPKGRPPEVGEHFVLSGAARTLKLIADSRGEAFYKGEIAEAIGASRRRREARSPRPICLAIGISCNRTGG